MALSPTLLSLLLLIICLALVYKHKHKQLGMITHTQCMPSVICTPSPVKQNAQYAQPLNSSHLIQIILVTRGTAVMLENPPSGLFPPHPDFSRLTGGQFGW